MCIPETPIAHPNSESLQESKDTNSPRSMEALQHVLQGHQQSQIHEVLQDVLQKVLDIKDEEANKSFSKVDEIQEI